jgi:anti-sigma factor RsiW
MKRDTPHDCPRVEALSLLIDGEISGAARREIEAHAASCPICGATLRDFRGLRSAFSALGDSPAGVDIAALIDARLPPRAPPRPARPAGQRSGWRWQLAPAGLAAAGVLATGAYLGMLLGGGAAVSTARPPAVAVFDAVPPGGLCAAPICYGQGR